MNKKFTKVVLSAMFTAGLLPFTVFQPNTADAAVDAKVAWTKRTVQVKNGKKWRRARKGTALKKGNYVRTGSKAKAQVRYADGSIIRLGSRTTIRVRNAKKGKSVRVRKGKARFKVNKQKKKMRVRTPSAVATVMGTEFIIDVKPVQTANAAVGAGNLKLAQFNGGGFTTNITGISGNVQFQGMNAAGNLTGAPVSVTGGFSSSAGGNTGGGAAAPRPVPQAQMQQIKQETGQNAGEPAANTPTNDHQGQVVGSQAGGADNVTPAGNNTTAGAGGVSNPANPTTTQNSPTDGSLELIIK